MSGICIWGCGECGNKTDAVAVSNITNINNTMINLVNKSSASATVTAYDVNKLKVTIDEIIGCDTDISQTINSTQKVSVGISFKDSTDLKAQLTTALTSANSDSNNQKTAFLQTAPNVSSSTQTINDAISNLITVDKTNDIATALTALAKDLNNGIIRIKKIKCTIPGQKIDITQGIVSSQIADVITKAITGTTVDEIVKASAKANNTNNNDQTGQGISQLVDSFFNGIGNIFSKGILAAVLAVVIPCVLCFGLIYFIVHHRSVSSAAATIPTQFGKITNSFSRFIKKIGKKTSRFGKK